MMTWESVREFLEELPGAEREPPAVGEGVRVRGKVVAFLTRNPRCRPDNAAADEEFAVIKVDRFERDALLCQDPGTFHVTPHIQSYPGVIVRLATVDPDQLQDLLIAAWRLVAPKRLVREWDQKGG